MPERSGKGNQSPNKWQQFRWQSANQFPPPRSPEDRPNSNSHSDYPRRTQFRSKSKKSSREKFKLFIWAFHIFYQVCTFFLFMANDFISFQAKFKCSPHSHLFDTTTTPTSSTYQSTSAPHGGSALCWQQQTQKGRNYQALVIVTFIGLGSRTRRRRRRRRRRLLLQLRIRFGTQRRPLKHSPDMFQTRPLRVPFPFRCSYAACVNL